MVNYASKRFTQYKKNIYIVKLTYSSSIYLWYIFERHIE